MEFWGVEVKPGEPLQIKPDVSKLIHISQAAVGEVKNGKGPKKVHLRLKIDGKMYVIGTLSAEDRPQILFDLVLHKEFELSHDWKEGSIYLAGYIGDDESYGEGFSDEDEDDQVDTLRNGNFGPPVKPATEKAALVKSKPSEKPMSKDAKLKKDKATSDEDGDDSDVGKDGDDDDDESELEEDSDALEHLMYGDDSNDDDDDDDSNDDESDDDDEQDLVSQKKRPSETAIESLVPAGKKTKLAGKKTKLASSEKSGGKTPATKGKLKKHNPKSGGQISSKSNSKTLNTNNALHPNTKAKRARK